MEGGDGGAYIVRASSGIVTMAVGRGPLAIMLASETARAYPADAYPGDYVIIIGIILTYLIAGIVLVGPLIPIFVRSPKAPPIDRASEQEAGRHDMAEPVAPRESVEQ